MSELCVGDPAPDLALRDAAEREVRLSTLWARAPTLAVFLRHFG